MLLFLYGQNISARGYKIAATYDLVVGAQYVVLKPQNLSLHVSTICLFTRLKYIISHHCTPCARVCLWVHFFLTCVCVCACVRWHLPNSPGGRYPCSICEPTDTYIYNHCPLIFHITISSTGLPVPRGPPCCGADCFVPRGGAWFPFPTFSGRLGHQRSRHSC